MRLIKLDLVIPEFPFYDFSQSLGMFNELLL